MEVGNTWMNNLLNILQARIIDWEIFEKPHEAFTEFCQELASGYDKWKKRPELNQIFIPQDQNCML